MTLLREPVSAFVLDIEGTTTPINFVYEVLFRFARAQFESFLTKHKQDADVLRDLESLREQWSADRRDGLNPPPLESEPASNKYLESAVGYLRWLMDQDRKSTPLKSLQGRIWREGYERRELRSVVFEDVPRAFERWHSAGKAIYIYSSGSVLAQKLLFANTGHGDLTAYLSGYFDTNVGPKSDSESYARIIADIGRAERECVFISDVDFELDAASQAGMQTLLCMRPGNRPVAYAARFNAVASFDVI